MQVLTSYSYIHTLYVAWNEKWLIPITKSQFVGALFWTHYWQTELTIRRVISILEFHVIRIPSCLLDSTVFFLTSGISCFPFFSASISNDLLCSLLLFSEGLILFGLPLGKSETEGEADPLFGPSPSWTCCVTSIPLIHLWIESFLSASKAPRNCVVGDH